MKHVELTKEVKKVNGKNVYRIRAIHAIPIHDVEAGDFGGYIDKKTVLSEQAWVGDEAVVTNSKLLGDILVDGEALVEDCLLVGFCRIRDKAKVKEVSGSGFLAKKNCRITDCNFKALHDTFIAFEINGDALVEKSRFEHTGRYLEEIVITDSVDLLNVDVKGRDIFFAKTTILNDVTIGGLNMVFSTSGEINKSIFNGKDINVTGDCAIEKLELDAKAAKISGKVSVKDGKWNVEKLTLEGNDILIEDSYMMGKNINLSDDIVIKKTILEGNGITIKDFVKLEGQPENYLFLMSKVNLSEAVQFLVNPNKNANHLHHVELRGDFISSGE